ncbi:MAG: 4Fe-4S binding protein [Candidatus Freyarchaeota archaeon]|nr:4Fe-4S binding protein [Candidatus Jordarchaeia archaeon]MBS7279363.1 4Fe-4S binding protein [Candidatus Jordarchaeia archaeon]
MSLEVGLDAPGKKVLLMGNEAVARGALEGNCQFAASYPGTPASEILETMARLAKDFEIYAQWSTNEAAAFWAGAGATYCGLRSMVSAKHHGVAWMTDQLIHISHWQIGKGGLVIVIGDDPKGHSSANEYDSRNLASRVFEIPILEPADPQESKEFTKIAFDFSEKLKLPIYVRMTTRVCHASGDVLLGEIPKEKRVPSYYPTFFELGMEMLMAKGWVDVSYLHERLHTKKLKEASEISENFPGNKLEISGDEEIGIIASGVCRHYVEEAMDKLGVKAAFLHLGMSFPLPKEKTVKLLKSVNKVIVFEETDPVIETEVRALAKDEYLGVEILGKRNAFTPISGELNPLDVMVMLSKAYGKPLPTVPERKELREMIKPYEGMRRIVLCAGCPHRASAYAVKLAAKTFKGGSYIGIGDIGCYGMMGPPPLMAFTLTNCMGGSIGLANGIAKTGIDQPVVAFIGDSTFYHAGIPPLINATFNNAKFTTIVLDNQVTALTGFQPHPGSGFTATGDKTKPVKIEDIARACGIEFVEVVDPYNIKKAAEVIKAAFEHSGASLVICRRLCSTEALRRRRSEGLPPPKPFMVDPDLCNGCKICINEFGCPAMIWDEKTKKVSIDETLCIGCAVCTQVCPEKAPKAVKE